MKQKHHRQTNERKVGYGCGVIQTYRVSLKPFQEPQEKNQQLEEL